MIKKFVFCLVLTLCFQTTVFAAVAFPDTENHWGKPFIDALSEKGAVSGMGDGLFHPDDLVNLKQFVTIIISSQFGNQELVNEDWASGFMKLAVEKGILLAEDLENPDLAITRLTAVRICHESLLNIFNENDEQDTSAAPRDLIDFNSCRTCRVHVEQVYAKGIINGRPGCIFDGNAKLTRAEACTIIMKMIDASLRNPPAPNTDEQITLISSDSVQNILNTDETALLVDVRDKQEYDLVHISGSICVPVDTIIDSNAEQFPDKNVTIVVYCQKGSRSLLAYNFLLEQGYTNVYTLGGIDNWKFDFEYGN